MLCHMFASCYPESNQRWEDTNSNLICCVPRVLYICLSRTLCINPSKSERATVSTHKSLQIWNINIWRVISKSMSTMEDIVVSKTKYSQLTQLLHWFQTSSTSCWCYSLKEKLLEIGGNKLARWQSPCN